MITGNAFWNASIEELKQGFIVDEKKNCYTCLICGRSFEVGVIYPVDELHYDAQRAIVYHLQTQHPPIFELYMSLGKIYTGLSPSQTELAQLFYKGYSDKEIVKMLAHDSLSGDDKKTGASSTSTIRNQRFFIREKYKQAKITTAIVEMLEEQLEQIKRERNMVPDDSELVGFHRTATNIDERYAITQAEKSKVLERYFAPNNEMLIEEFPAKEKKKIIIMQHISKEFECNTIYTEREVNEILKKFYQDYVTIRRYLVQYGFLDRSKDGKEYWIKL